MMDQFAERIHRAQQHFLAVAAAIRPKRQIARLGEDDADPARHMDVHFRRALDCAECRMEHRTTRDEIALLQFQPRNDIVPREADWSRSHWHFQSRGSGRASNGREETSTKRARTVRISCEGGKSIRVSQLTVSKAVGSESLCPEGRLAAAIGRWREGFAAVLMGQK